MAEPPVLTDVIGIRGLTKPKKKIGRPLGRGDRITLSAELVDELKGIAGEMSIACGFKPTLEQTIRALISHYRGV